MTELPYTEESVMRRLDTPERDRQTDIRTDGRTVKQNCCADENEKVK